MSAYWNPKTETLSREELGRLQGHRLQRVVERSSDEVHMLLVKSEAAMLSRALMTEVTSQA